jgi:CRISPR-associated protein Csm1
MSNKKEKIYLASLLKGINKSKNVGYDELITEDAEINAIISEAEILSIGKEKSSSKHTLKTSILQNINSGMNNEEYVIPPLKIALNKTVFPVRQNEIKGNAESVWNDFVEEMRYIDTSEPFIFAESLFNLLFRYAVNLPAVETDDVSLYDSIKSSAAISTCLYSYYKECPNGDTPFILIGGDMSGIQTYIYEIVSKYAGKNLKGRSFYLRLLSDAIVGYISKELDLYQANTIYNSGGSFYLLAPNTNFIKEKLINCISTIEEKMLNEHGTNLFVAIDFVEVNKPVLLHTNGCNLQDTWKELFEKRDKKKQNKLNSIILKNYSRFFEPIMIGGEQLRDSITGEEFQKNEKPYKNKELPDIEKIGNIKESTGKQILLGKLLRETDIMVKSNQAIATIDKSKEFCPIGLGIYYYFLKLSDIDKYKELQIPSSNIHIVTLNTDENGRCDFAEKLKTSKSLKSIEFYGGNSFNESTFEEMCENENYHRLGILRMDVDNLGSIFQSGIPKEKASFARYSELSRSFDYFFSGYLNTIQLQEEFKDKSFIIYSGGDDLFIVGDWRAMIDMAKQIREDFREYTCFNPAFSISGGIAIVPDKYPIMRGAKHSEDEEHNAKTHACFDKEKNAISFMNFALNWDEEFPKVKSLKDNLVEELQSDLLSKSFISKVMSHWQEASIKNHKITNFKTYWMMTYDLGRMKGRVKDNSAKQLIENCKNECCSNKTTLNNIPIVTNYHPLELWAFAARWAELETRSNK